MINPKIEMRLIDERGVEKVIFAYGLEQKNDDLALEIPKPCDITGTAQEVFYKIKARSMRDYNFENIGRILGKRIAQTLSDMEGWHGEDRKQKTVNSQIKGANPR